MVFNVRKDGDDSRAAYSLFFGLFFFNPGGACVLHGFRRALQHRMGHPAFLRVSGIDVIKTLVIIHLRLYLWLNSVACSIFVAKSRAYCATRAIVSCALASSIACFGGRVFTLRHFTPRIPLRAPFSSQSRGRTVKLVPS